MKELIALLEAVRINLLGTISEHLQQSKGLLWRTIQEPKAE